MIQKRFLCFDYSRRFEDLEDLNKHIAKTGCNNKKQFTAIDYCKSLIQFVFREFFTVNKKYIILYRIMKNIFYALKLHIITRNDPCFYKTITLMS